MSFAVTLRALQQNHADAWCKALRDIARYMGTDAETGARPADAEALRQELAAVDGETRLLALSRDAAPVVRELAVDALAAFGGDAARTRLLEACGDDVLEVRASAVGGLENWPVDREVVEVLLIALDDSKWLVRMRATRALAAVPGANVDAALITMLLDSENYVRTTAADALAVRPPEAILPRLRRLMQQPSPHLFDAAFDVMGRIGVEEDAAFLARVGRFINWSQPGPVKAWARAAARAIRARQRQRR